MSKHMLCMTYTSCSVSVKYCYIKDEVLLTAGIVGGCSVLFFPAVSAEGHERESEMIMYPAD